MMNLFDWLNEITFNKRPWDNFTSDDKESFNIYMVHRFVSMDSDYIDIVNMIQKYPNCSRRKIYNFYCNVLPKKKTFFKYIKSSNKWDNDILDKVSKYYNISIREAKECVSILTDNKLKEILNLGQSSTNKKRRKKQ